MDTRALPGLTLGSIGTAVFGYVANSPQTLTTVGECIAERIVYGRWTWTLFGVASMPALPNLEAGRYLWGLKAGQRVWRQHVVLRTGTPACYLAENKKGIRRAIVVANESEF